MKTVHRPRLPLLLSLGTILQLTVLSIIVFLNRGVVDINDNEPRLGIVLFIVLLGSMVVSALVRYTAVYLLSWTVSHNKQSCKRVYSRGLYLNGAFEIIQAIVLVHALLLTDKDPSWLVFIIPFSGSAALIVTVIMLVYSWVRQKGAS